MNELILTDAEISQVKMSDYPIQGKNSEQLAIALAQARKILDWIDKNSEKIYEREWIDDDFIPVDYIKIHKTDYEALLKAGGGK
jgi:hypothetical protein